MKRIAMVVFVLSVLVVAGCGSSGSGTDCTTGEAAAQTSFDDFGTIMANDDIQPCLGASNVCPCPNGGTLTTDMVALTMTFADCQSATDRIYSGAITLSADFISISGSMNPFGDCTNVTATSITVEGACGGTISGTCGGQNLQCNIADDGEGGCDLDCTC